MKNMKAIRIVLMAVVCMFFGLTQAKAAEFSADMVSRNGTETFAAKVYVADKKSRTETPENIIITRMDKNVSYMLMPSEKMYMEHPIDVRMVPKTSKELTGETERQSLGKETVNEQSAEKFKVTYTENGKTENVYQWITNAQIPIKTEAVDGSWSMEYQNLKIAAQPADLFEPPASYQKMSMPSMGDMLKGAMGK